MGFFGDSMGICGNIWDYMGVHEMVLDYSVGSCKVIWGFYATIWDYMRLYRRLYGIHGGRWDFGGFLWNLWWRMVNSC